MQISKIAPLQFIKDSKKMLRVGVAIAFLFLSINTDAQINRATSERPYFVSLRLHYGYIYDHAHTMAGIVQSYLQSGELEFGRHLNFSYHSGTKEIAFEYGMAFYSSNLGNPEVLGNSFAFYPFIKVPIMQGVKKSLTLKIGSGLAYLSKPYDALTNPYNASISSHFNVFAQFSTEYPVFVSQKFEIYTGMSLTHYSNGASMMPNLGINVVTAQTNLRYKFGNSSRNKTTILDSEKINIVAFTPTFGWKQRQATGPNTFKVWDFSLEYLRTLNTWHKIGFGFDVFYDPSWRDIVALSESSKNTHDYNQGIHFVYALQFSKLWYFIDLGTYFHWDYEAWQKTYHRIGLRYQFTKNFYLNLSLKSFWANAQNIEWGVGFKL